MRFGKFKLAAAAVAVVLLVGTAAGMALAGPSTPGSASGGFYQDFVAKLAANLGISQAKLTGALTATKQQMLAEAVQQGKLTQAQADKLASRPGLFAFHRQGRPGFGFFGKNETAAALGLTPAQLKSDLQAGKTIKQIVAAQGMTMQQFRQKMLSLTEQAISQAVTEGKLTQEQANRLIQRMQHRFNRSDSSTPSSTAQS